MRRLSRLGILVVLLAVQPVWAEDTPDIRLKQVEQQLEKSRGEREENQRKAREAADELAHIRVGMVAAARAAQESEDQLSGLESQLADLTATEKAKSEALGRRSGQMTRVLTALQRLAWRPTEALLAQPQSPADTVRSAILLRAAVPEIERSVKTLRDDIDAVAVLRAGIGEQKKRIAQSTQVLDAEHNRMKDLYDRKAQIETAAEAATAEVDQRMKQLAAEADDLRDLLKRLDEERQRRLAEAAAKAAAERAAREAEIAARQAAREAEIAAQKAAREAELAAKRAEQENREREQAQARAAREAELAAAKAAREKEIEAEKASRDAEQATRAAAAAKPAALAPGTPFGTARGRMPPPARGRIVTAFGQEKEGGLIAKGMDIQTRKDAQVIAPADGQVAFAGSFRGYGLLLIIEHAEGYHTLLAGMTRIDVAVGQRLGSGEPVGVMGPDDKPVLYVELRRNGQPIDPAPWFSAQGGKAHE